MKDIKTMYIYCGSSRSLLSMRKWQQGTRLELKDAGVSRKGSHEGDFGRLNH